MDHRTGAVATQAPARILAPGEVPDGARARPRDAVLIVDDSLTVRMDLAEAFQGSGLRPLTCASLGEARAALAGDSIAVAILDVLLPDGDGLDLLQEIRAGAATADLPVLMLSTEAEVRDRIRGLRTGATDYVGKPYDRGQVVSRAWELARRQEQPRPADHLTGQPTILIIDDSPTFRDGLGRVLTAAGYAVLEAETGEQGLRLAADHRPHAIIVDGMMPGIDGRTVVRRVRADLALRGTPCLMLTASDTGEAELQALDAGADAFASKAEDLGVILARLAALLRNSGSGRANAASLLAPKRILAVDDSATYLHALSDMLREEGYDVIQASSGEEAMEMLAAQSVDCILLDLLMPGMGGREACRRIKLSPAMRAIPLVMLTSMGDRDAMIEGLALGADDYISKSSDFALLRARVRAQLRRKQFEDEHRRVREELLHSELEAAEALAARQLAEARAALSDQLASKNKELEAFSYSVSHDLRAPLRVVDGFSRALQEGYGDVLDDQGRNYLRRIRAGAQRMGELIEDLLELSRYSATELHRERIDLAELARSAIAELQRREPERQATFVTEDEIVAEADRRLMRVVLENLLGNAWKFTARTASARIEFHAQRERDSDGAPVFLVRDNGAGFDMAFASKLFAPFQRLHDEADYPGTGVGLATVQRILNRHHGRVWAESAVGQGTTIFFTLADPLVEGRTV